MGQANLPTAGEQQWLQYWIFYSSTMLAVVGGQANLSSVREQQCLQDWILYSSTMLARVGGQANLSTAREQQCLTILDTLLFYNVSCSRRPG